MYANGIQTIGKQHLKTTSSRGNDIYSTATLPAAFRPTLAAALLLLTPFLYAAAAAAAAATATAAATPCRAHIPQYSASVFSDDDARQLAVTQLTLPAPAV